LGINAKAMSNLRLEALCGVALAYEILSLKQCQWKAWCDAHAILERIDPLEDGKVYYYDLDNITLVVFVEENFPAYQELVVRKGLLEVEIF
jgi:hypothetical protein